MSGDTKRLRAQLMGADATCLEGALKIKEVSYMHSEGVSTARDVAATQADVID